MHNKQQKQADTGRQLVLTLPLTHQGEAANAGGQFCLSNWGWVFPDNPQTMAFVRRVEEETGAVVEIRKPR